jgi:hypothetical protein
MFQVAIDSATSRMNRYDANSESKPLNHLVHELKRLHREASSEVLSLQLRMRAHRKTCEQSKTDAGIGSV